LWASCAGWTNGANCTSCTGKSPWATWTTLNDYNTIIVATIVTTRVAWAKVKTTHNFTPFNLLWGLRPTTILFTLNKLCANTDKVIKNNTKKVYSNKNASTQSKTYLEIIHQKCDEKC
jgi:hypothetical protein